jgi:hypothetical protein
MGKARKGYTRVKFIVKADVPNDASITDAKNFIREWLETGGGCRHPDDPLFGSFENVTVGKASLAEG